MGQRCSGLGEGEVDGVKFVIAEFTAYYLIELMSCGFGLDR